LSLPTSLFSWSLPCASPLPSRHPFGRTAVQLTSVKRSWARLPTCHIKGGEDETWPQLSLFWKQPARALPFARALPQAPALLGRPAASRGWSLRRKEEPGNPQCERANALFYFNLGNASYVFFFSFPSLFFIQSRRESPHPIKKTETSAFLSDIPAVLKCAQAEESQQQLGCFSGRTGFPRTVPSSGLSFSLALPSPPRCKGADALQGQWSCATAANHLVNPSSGARGWFLFCFPQALRRLRSVGQGAEPRQLVSQGAGDAQPGRGTALLCRHRARRWGCSSSCREGAGKLPVTTDSGEARGIHIDRGLWEYS